MNCNTRDFAFFDGAALHVAGVTEVGQVGNDATGSVHPNFEVSFVVNELNVCKFRKVDGAAVKTALVVARVVVNVILNATEVRTLVGHTPVGAVTEDAEEHVGFERAVKSHKVDINVGCGVESEVKGQFDVVGIGE